MSLIALMAAGTAAVNVALVLGVIALFRRNWRGALVSFVAARGRLVVFLLSLGAVAGTLWMQYFANLPPCVLCWWQRVFMYPIPLIAGIAIVKNTDFSEIADYILGLSALGAAVALYQHLLQMLPQGALIPCSATDECAVRSVFEFGYITLPWMAFSLFAAFAFISLVGRARTR